MDEQIDTVMAEVNALLNALFEVEQIIALFHVCFILRGDLIPLDE